MESILNHHSKLYLKVGGWAHAAPHDASVPCPALKTLEISDLIYQAKKQ